MGIEETTRIGEVTWDLEAAELLLSLGLKDGGEEQSLWYQRKKVI